MSKLKTFFFGGEYENGSLMKMFMELPDNYGAVGTALFTILMVTGVTLCFVPIILIIKWILL